MIGWQFLLNMSLCDWWTDRQKCYSSISCCP